MQTKGRNSPPVSRSLPNKTTSFLKKGKHMGRIAIIAVILIVVNVTVIAIAIACGKKK